MVKFNYYFDQYDISKSNKNENYNPERRENENVNRRLRKIEEYMKKHNLLLQHEFLEFSDVEQKHLRTPYIECICRKKHWLSKGEFLKIIY